MSLRQVNGDVVLSGALGSGTHRSAAVAAPGAAADMVVMVHVSAVSGTSPTLAVSVEQSADGSSFTAVPGGAAATLTAVGSTLANVQITQPYARVAAVIGGTNPNFTFRVAALVFAE